MMAVLCAAAAVIMFFAYDIRRCWQIVRGKRVNSPSVKRPAIRPSKRKKMPAESAQTQKLILTERTQMLPLEARRSTALLVSEETVPLGTMDLVQDITMMDV